MMLTIGLTGGSGAGKGYVAALFAQNGIPALDTDLVSRQVCAPGQPCTRELAKAFGSGILASDGSLNRPKLAAIAFADRQKLEILNAVTHKYILDECRLWLSTQRKGGAHAAIIDAPQLFESGFDRECDITVAVVADVETRLRRILQRDGIPPEAARRRIERQHSDLWFRSHCTYTISNGFAEDPTAAVQTLCRIFSSFARNDRNRKEG